MVGELCKSGNIKFKVDANATTIKILFNGIINPDLTSTWASSYEFCAKRLIK
jgi:hypothetical protein